MIKSKKYLALVLVSGMMAFFTLVNSQENLKAVDQESELSTFSYQVKKVFPPLSYTDIELEQMQTISDMNRFYKKSWVSEYTSVVIKGQIDGKQVSAKSKDDVLTDNQKALLKNFDNGTELDVMVFYYPDNSLSLKEEKVYDFTLVKDPSIDASYTGGEEQLLQYFKERVIDKIPDGLFTGYKFASVKFHIDEQGRVVNPNIFWSSGDQLVDKLLLETVCNMPVWSPAKYNDGTKVKQEYTFNIGNMESCAINTLNLDKTSWAAEDK